MAAVFEDRCKGAMNEETWAPLEAGRGKTAGSPHEPPGKAALLMPWDHAGPLTSRPQGDNCVSLQGTWPVVMHPSGCGEGVRLHSHAGGL